MTSRKPALAAVLLVGSVISLAADIFLANTSASQFAVITAERTTYTRGEKAFCLSPF